MNSCPHCGNWHSDPCPYVKSIEYFENGMIKKIEYKSPYEPIQQEIDYSPHRIPVTPEFPFDSTWSEQWSN